MKKKKLSSLNLNKKAISRLNSSKIKGGENLPTDFTCVGSPDPDCTFGTNCCTGPMCEPRTNVWDCPIP